MTSTATNKVKKKPKTKVRHRVFMPPKMPKVPKGPVLPKYPLPEAKGEVGRLKHLCSGGPWAGEYLTVALFREDATMVFSAKGFKGRYVSILAYCNFLRWEDV